MTEAAFNPTLVVSFCVMSYGGKLKDAEKSESPASAPMPAPAK